MKNSFSIIIPTYKRKKHVINLLKSLVNKVPIKTEIIIVEQKERNENIYKLYARKYGLNVRYFFLSNPSTSKAKNVGIFHSKNNFIVFFDDDVLVKTKIDSFLNDFKDPNVGGVTGRSFLTDEKFNSKVNNTGRISFLGSFSDGFSSTTRQEIDTVIGCNAAWRKKVLIALKGFDEKFTGNAMREESDLSLRAKSLGFKILFDPSIEVLHVRATSGGARKTEGRLQWYYDFFSNETYFFLKHRPTWVVPLIMLTRWEWMARCMFGFGREVSFRSLTTPISGVIDGYRKYRRYLYENRN